MGYHAHVNYERANSRLTNRFICTTLATKRQELAQRALDIPADVVEIVVKGDAPIAGKTLKEANQEDLLSPCILVVRLDRGEELITPNGSTVIQADDFVTVHSRWGITDDTFGVFTGK